MVALKKAILTILSESTCYKDQINFEHHFLSLLGSACCKDEVNFEHHFLSLFSQNISKVVGTKAYNRFLLYTRQLLFHFFFFSETQFSTDINSLSPLIKPNFGLFRKPKLKLNE